MGLKFKPFFFQPDEKTRSAWDTTEWETRSSLITSSEGEVIFKMDGVEVPANWSQLATDIIASKYFRKAGVTNEKGCEHSLKQLVRRVVLAIVEYGRETGYFSSDEDAENFANDLKWLLIHQYGAFNSPVWFNVGLWPQYQIKGNGKNFAWSGGDSYEQIDNQYERPQASACFIQSVEDDLLSIFELCKNEASIFKYGSGAGANMSRLRGVNERLSGGGKSSGLLSFLKVLDSAAGAIKSGGTTRRAAVMRCLDADHPEILNFIDWKVKEEKKAQALINQGYSSDFNGEAYATVSGQNSNNAVRLTDEFMRAVEKDEDWPTINRTTGEIHETHKARLIFHKICEAAWRCADPGVQYDTNINKHHTCANSGPIRASNPCSEFMFIDDSACNLASLNLIKFFGKEGFDVQAFENACRVFFTAQDILVDLGSYPTYKIARNSHCFRPLGLGYSNLGALLMMAGYPYDSDEGRAMAGLVTSIMTGCAYQVSTEIAEHIGAFEKYSENREIMIGVVKENAQALERETYRVKDPKLVVLREAAEKYWLNAIKKGSENGFRNAQATVLAPTGTIGLLMDCATTGVEPAFSLVMWKKLAGGGVIPIVNQSVPNVLKQLGYNQKQIDSIVEHVKKHSTIEKAEELQEKHLPIFDCAIAGGRGTRSIQYMGHVKMMAAVQPFVSGAISKTINIPKESSVEDIRNIFVESWKMGLKAITIYRDASKGSQPLNTEPDKEEQNNLETIQYLKKEVEKLQKFYETKKDKKEPTWGSARKLPNERRGKTWEFKVAGTKVFLRSGENPDGSLGEIFVDLGYKEGSTVRALMNQFAISISFSLQHGVPLEKLVDRFSFTKFEPHGRVTGHPYLKSATSLVDAIFRILGHYYLGRDDFFQIKPPKHNLNHNLNKNASSPLSQTSADNYKTRPINSNDHMPCTECGGIDFLRTGTCFVCITCGASQGCS